VVTAHEIAILATHVRKLGENSNFEKGSMGETLKMGGCSFYIGQGDYETA